jgi:anaerobic ribonucleoside-triphosphate reductase activating protein
MSRDTWDPGAGQLVGPPEIVAWLDGLPLVTGVTVSGGEPFQQPVALAALLRAIRDWSARRVVHGAQPVDVMAYSGYPAAALRRDPARRAALELCDVAVVGPYLRARAPGRSWRGSANQRLLVRTPLGAQRFGPDADGHPHRGDLQLSSDGEHWWLIGVPAPEEIDRLRERLAARGVALAAASWDPVATRQTGPGAGPR